jgi:uncharacterized protein YraI
MKQIRLFAIILVVLTLMAGVPALARVAEAQSPQLSLPILVINTGNLNVRSGPGPQYSILAVLPGGTQVPVLGTNPSNTWYLVGTAQGAGWVDVSFTLPRGDFRYVPVIRTVVTTPAPVQVPNSLGLPTQQQIPVPALQPGQIIVNTSRLNVRSGPGAQFSVIAVTSGGVSLAPLGVTPDGVWYLVEGIFGRGWVAAEYTIFRGVYGAIPVIAY